MTIWIWVVLAVVAVLILRRLGEGSVAMPPQAAPDSPKPVDKGPSAGITVGKQSPLEREAWLRQNIQNLGQESFPEDPDVAWRVLAVTHKGAFSAAEAEAHPATVGYPKFKFVAEFTDGPRLVGCLCWNDGKWEPLFSVEDAPEDWLELA